MSAVKCYLSLSSLNEERGGGGVCELGKSRDLRC